MERWLEIGKPEHHDGGARGRVREGTRKGGGARGGGGTMELCVARLTCTQGLAPGAPCT